MRLSAVLLLLFITIVMIQLSEARGRGGGSRGGSRSSRGSRSRSRSGSSSKPKITKYTPIKPTTVRSPVIVKQATLGSRSNTFKRVLFGYIVYRYAFSRAPVYRGGYPMYGSYVSIPKERAVRITYEEQQILNAEGKTCAGQSEVTLREGIDENLVELNTTVKYKTGEAQTYYNRTISLEDIKEEDFEVTSRARYNTTIVVGTFCTQVEKKVKGTMVTMYETNPNTASPLSINNKLFANALIAFLAFQYLY